MSRTSFKLAGCIAAMGMTLYLTPTSLAGQENYLSPSAMVADERGKTLYIAEATAKQVAVFDTKSGKVTRTMDVPAEPTGLTLTANGAYLYATCAAPQGHLCVIETSANKIIRQTPAGYGACSPVLSPDGGTLYVCNRFTDDVSVFNIEQNKQVAKIDVLREPVAADITQDGKWLYVGNHLPAGPADAGIVASEVSVINTKTVDIDTSISLPNGSTAVQGVVVSPDGKYVYITHILARYTLPTTQLERGWMNTNALSIIDAKSRRLVDTVLLDDVDSGAANPWAVACTSDGKYICVTHAGTHELSIIDTGAMLDKIKRHHDSAKTDQDRSQGQYGYVSDNAASYSNVPNELSFLYGIRQRVKLCGNGPRALAVVGSKVYVAEYFTDSMTLVDISTKPKPKVTALALSAAPEMTVKRKGEMVFNDALTCFQHWQSCASCHPGGGRVDGLNWDLLNDGIGNPKNTKSLLLSHKTPPAMVTGVRGGAEVAVRMGFKHILFVVRPEAEAATIDKYLKSLKPVPSPYLVDGKLNKSARRGRRIFKKADCASCHKRPLYTDLEKYDVGTGKDREKGMKFDTPTLVEVWRTAPYLYDGRATTIKDVLTTHNSNDKHGKTSNLTEKQINDLAEFVLSQ
jgi:YVTN family beta-propeller protein